MLPLARRMHHRSPRRDGRRPTRQRIGASDGSEDGLDELLGPPRIRDTVIGHGRAMRVERALDGRPAGTRQRHVEQSRAWGQLREWRDRLGDAVDARGGPSHAPYDTARIRVRASGARAGAGDQASGHKETRRSLRASSFDRWDVIRQRLEPDRPRWPPP